MYRFEGSTEEVSCRLTPEKKALIPTQFPLEKCTAKKSEVRSLQAVSQVKLFAGVVLCALCAATTSTGQAGTSSAASTDDLFTTPSGGLSSTFNDNSAAKSANTQNTQYAQIWPGEENKPAPTNAPDTSIVASSASSGPKNDLQLMATYFPAQGNVVLPFGYSLSQNPALKAYVGFQPISISPPRHSRYYGGNFTHAFSHHSFLDLSYAHGVSSGGSGVPANLFAGAPSTFSIKDDWAQVYYRYIPRFFDGKPYSAYLRAGATYVHSDFVESTLPNPAGISYVQHDPNFEVLGNVGYGIGYVFPFSSPAHKFSVLHEGEGFAGERRQKVQETVSSPGFEFIGPEVPIQNLVYGGLGRFTARYQYLFGSSGRLRLVVDGGVQCQYSIIHYDIFGNEHELLWGPYVRGGVRFLF